MTANDRQPDFGALLQCHAGIVFKVANSYARSVEDRADLAQEIAAQLWHAYPNFDHARSFSTGMYRIALNVASAICASRNCDGGMMRNRSTSACTTLPTAMPRIRKPTSTRAFCRAS